MVVFNSHCRRPKRKDFPAFLKSRGTVKRSPRSFIFALWLALSPALQAATMDWLLDPAPFIAKVLPNEASGDLTLDNGLVRRVIRLKPNAATVDLENLTTGEHLLRAVGPEAWVTIDGVQFPVGGLDGQPVKNYISAEWLDTLRANPNAYRFAGWKEGPIQARMAWHKHPEWLSRDLPWPPHGRHVVLRFVPPAAADSATVQPQAPRDDLPEVEIHYEIYDGLPLLSKWLVVTNTTSRSVRLNRFISEELHFVEAESTVGGGSVPREFPNLWVETDYAFGGNMSPSYDNPGVQISADPDYPTQVNYLLQTPCLLRCQPLEMGPDAQVQPREAFESFRAFDLLLDSTERERRTLAQRRMYRAIAPWTAENPLMFHKVNSDPKSIREAIQQAHQAGFEMIIMSFGSGMNLENTDPKYLETYKELAAEAKSNGIALGAYSLLASRGAADPKDNTQGRPTAFGVMPCLGARWGEWYLGQLRHFLGEAGLGVLEHDGSYPGDRCAATNHPGHHGLEDSQWVQWRAITDFYKWCRSEGIFLNIPDWYYLSGGNKCGMGYRETDWSLPRAQQEIIERQNIFDGTWNKTASMGWMFVPLSQYHGGGAPATIEPLKDHLPHYRQRLANLLGAGVQACWRGPRLFDTPQTEDLVKKWVAFYKNHRQVLDGDIIHLRRANGQDWDGWLHVNPQGKEKGLLMVYNPLDAQIRRILNVPLYYTGLTRDAKVREQDGKAVSRKLARDYSIDLDVTIPARGLTWFVLE
jgi:hypothetical protein